ncbi:MAG: hypothetical protein E6J82_18805 [Deltaproteobacteria bacterium]|nr:MAG: hypothetical protein E6J82_18805 [Deltaproteobacteria bacterium]
MRIVSLLPSATEIVCALGAADELVGISHECDFPESIRGRPVLTRARIDAGASSRAIDAAVRAVVRDALSIYVVDCAPRSRGWRIGSKWRSSASGPPVCPMF